MADGRIGVFGALGIFLLLILKLLLISELQNREVLLIMPALSRWGMCLSIFSFPYAKEKGKGRIFKEGMNKRALFISTITTLILSTLFLSIKGLILMAMIFPIVIVSGKIIRGNIGGLTGDSYGAINEICEVLTLVFSFIPVEGGFIWERFFS